MEITYPSGRKAAYSFDVRNQLDEIDWDGSQIEDRSYDDLGRLTGVDRPGIDETRTYDAAGRLTAINNTNVGDATYTYDANHNKLSESWSGAMAAWNFVTTSSGGNPDGYDAEDRFQCAFNVRRPQLAADRRSATFKKRRKRKFAQSAQSKTFNFTRSDIGNINNINLNEGSSRWGTARTFNNIHALTGIGSDNQTFDVDGNLTGSHAGHTLGWDEAGMMKDTVVPNGSSFGIEGTTEYGYDADRKRVWKKFTPHSKGGSVVHTVYVYAGPNCIAEYPAGTAAASPTQEYVYAQEIDSLVLLVRGGGSDKYTITRNQQWSVTALAELASGTIVERYTYDHFGKRTILESNGTTVRSTSSYGMPYGYTSRRHDAETDLMYFRARYYDPHTAEFISTDPLEYVDGMSLFRGYFVGGKIDPIGTYMFLQDGAHYRCPSQIGYMENRNRRIVCEKTPCQKFICDYPTKYPKFDRLVKCAVRNRCMNEGWVICKKCDPKESDAAYSFPLFSNNRIKICERILNDSELERILLEEAYHALTICYGGNRLGQSLTSLNAELVHSKLSSRLKDCGKCIGRELIALKCARPNTQFNVLLNLAFASCRNCDPDYLSNSHENYTSRPLGNILTKWFNSGKLEKDCEDIDFQCK